MADRIQNRWVQLVAVGAAMAVIGVVVSALLFSDAGGVSSGSVGDRVVFSTGGTIQASGEGARVGKLGTAGDEPLPLTVAAAVAAGWKDPILCSVGRGRYFQKTGAGGDEVPYFLMFGGENALIGIYQFSETEMPPPWRQLDDLLGGGGLKLLDEHWGLFIYFQDPVRACGVRSSISDYSAP